MIIPPIPPLPDGMRDPLWIRAWCWVTDWANWVFRQKQ